MSTAELLALASRYRETLRHSVYLSRSLDTEGELSTTQTSILNMVAAGPARVSSIARNLGIKVPSATQAVIKLEAAGLLARTQDTADARAVLVSLTAAGDASLRAANHRRNSVMAAALAALTPEERAAIEAAIPAMGKLSGPGLP
ncbi:MAG: MarR family winged helix-turn-helix transcriptional regulator [Actinomycetales bacterium]